MIIVNIITNINKIGIKPQPLNIERSFLLMRQTDKQYDNIIIIIIL